MLSSNIHANSRSNPRLNEIEPVIAPAADRQPHLNIEMATLEPQRRIPGDLPYPKPRLQQPKIRTEADRDVKICLNYLVGGIALVVAGGCTSILALSIMGLKNKGPMYVHRNCSMVNDTMTYLPTQDWMLSHNHSASGNSSLQHLECRLDTRMRDSIVGAAVVSCMLSVLLTCVCSCFCLCGISDHYYKLTGEPVTQHTPVFDREYHAWQKMTREEQEKERERYFNYIEDMERLVRENPVFKMEHSSV
jgi:hypothetical protein